MKYLKFMKLHRISIFLIKNHKRCSTGPRRSHVGSIYVDGSTDTTNEHFTMLRGYRQRQRQLHAAMRPQHAQRWLSASTGDKKVPAQYVCTVCPSKL